MHHTHTVLTIPYVQHHEELFPDLGAAGTEDQYMYQVTVYRGCMCSEDQYTYQVTVYRGCMCSEDQYMYRVTIVPLL
jgi:hypothetical protein